MKRLSLNFKLLALIVLLTGFSASAYDFCSDQLNYNILSEEDRTIEVASTFIWGTTEIEIPRKVIYESKTYTVISVGVGAFSESSVTSVTIPNSVTSIGESAFYVCRSLTSVTIPNSVTSIGDFAFSQCSSLTSVTIPNSVTSIGIETFYNCESLTSVTIPNSVTSIGAGAFSYCKSLTSVTIPNSVTSIGNWAFQSCNSLTSVTIPNSVTSIGAGAFSRDSALVNINVDPENAVYSSIDGVLYTKDATTLICCGGGKTSVTIPNSVTSIGAGAFSYCKSLTSVTIPNSVTSIGAAAFYTCSSLTSVTIPNSVTSIGEEVFRYCSSLTSVTIPNSVTSIGKYAFYDCHSLTSVTLPNSVTSIEEEAFRGCSSLTYVAIPNSVTSIGRSAFSDCDKLKAIYVQWQVPVEFSLKFSDTIYKEAVLYVPIGTKAAYEKVDPWRNFWNIEEGDYNDVDVIEADNNGTLQISVNNGVLTITGIGSDESISVYDMQGRTVYNGTSHTIDNLQSGLYIVKVKNRTIKISI